MENNINIALILCNMVITLARVVKHLKNNILEFIKMYNEETVLGRSITLNLKPIFEQTKEVLQNLKDSLNTAFFNRKKIEAYLKNIGEEQPKEDQIKLTEKGGYVQDVFLISNFVFETLPEIIEDLQTVIAEEKEEKKKISRTRKKIKKTRKEEKREAKYIKDELKRLEEEEENRIRNLENIDISEFSSAEKRLHKTIIDLYNGHKKFYKQIKEIYNKSLELLEVLRELNEKVQKQQVKFAEEINNLIINIVGKIKEIQRKTSEYKLSENQFDIEIEKLREEFRRIAGSVGLPAA